MIIFNAGDSELQHVPGSFSSVDEYAKVFEPLLFEECRAQLHNCWEELLEGTNGDPHAAVAIKTIERRERGNWDILLFNPWRTKTSSPFSLGRLFDWSFLGCSLSTLLLSVTFQDGYLLMLTLS